MRRLCAAVALLLFSSATAAAQDRIQQLARIPVGDTVVTIWATNAGTVLVRAGTTFGAPEFRLAPSDSALSISSTATLVGTIGLHPSPADVRQIHGAIVKSLVYAWRLANGRAVSTDQPYFEYQVELSAVEIDTISMVYPPMLRSTRIEGQVLAQFVVDTLGRVELESFKVLKSSHDLFTNALRQALPALRFRPAMAGGRKVRQLVQKRYLFTVPQSP